MIVAFDRGFWVGKQGSHPTSVYSEGYHLSGAQCTSEGFYLLERLYNAAHILCKGLLAESRKSSKACFLELRGIL